MWTSSRTRSGLVLATRGPTWSPELALPTTSKPRCILEDLADRLEEERMVVGDDDALVLLGFGFSFDAKSVNGDPCGGD